jgi:hypothetical protein
MSVRIGQSTTLFPPLGVFCVLHRFCYITHTLSAATTRMHKHTLGARNNGEKMVKILTGSRYRRIDYQHTARSIQWAARWSISASPRRLMQPADTLSKKLSHQAGEERRCAPVSRSRTHTL